MAPPTGTKLSWTEFYNAAKKNNQSDYSILNSWTKYNSTGKLPSDIANAAQQLPASSVTNMPTTYQQGPPVYNSWPGVKTPTAPSYPASWTPLPPFNDNLSMYGANNTTATYQPGMVNGQAPAPAAPDPFSLDAILAALNQGSTGGVADYLATARQMLGSTYDPQFQTIATQAANAKSSYANADPIIAQLYSQLQNNISGSADQTAANTAAQVAARGQQGKDLAATIAGTYGSLNNQQADMLAKLGLQSAAPQTLAPASNESAWQQGQANLGTQQQQDILQNAGNASTDVQRLIAAATGNQGAIARTNLLNSLNSTLSGLSTQQTNLGSNQQTDILNLAKTLASQAASDQNSHLSNLLQGYNLNRQQANDYFTQQMQLYNAGLPNDIGTAPTSTNLTSFEKNAAAIANTYGDQGTNAISIALQASVDPNNLTDTATFIHAVQKAAQSAGVTNSAAILEAANLVLPTLNLKGTGVQ